jgi:hypothetical protein
MDLDGAAASGPRLLALIYEIHRIAWPCPSATIFIYNRKPFFIPFLVRYRYNEQATQRLSFTEWTAALNDSCSPDL